jgi:peroxiredoxin
MFHQNRRKTMSSLGKAGFSWIRGASNGTQTAVKRTGCGAAERYLGGFRGVALAAMMACIFAFPAGAWTANPPPPAAASKALAEKAPDFVLRDLKGQTFRLSDRRGKKPVLIIFSTTWCAFCKAEIPHFKSIQATYVKQGLEIVNIDIQESKEKVSRFTAEHQLPYRILLDEDGTVSGVYDIRGVPSLVLIDKSGMIACRQCRNVETLLETMLKR